MEINEMITGLEEETIDQLKLVIDKCKTANQDGRFAFITDGDMAHLISDIKADCMHGNKKCMVTACIIGATTASITIFGAVGIKKLKDMREAKKLEKSETEEEA